MNITKKFIAKCLVPAAALCLSAAFYHSTQAETAYTPIASGTLTYQSEKVLIDASNTSDGYIMITYTGSNPKVKIRISKDTDYTYDIANTGDYVTFPLSEGSGTYTIKLYENISGSSYAQALSQSIAVSLKNETTPFLYSNQFCDFHAGSAVVALSDSLTSGLSEPLQKVEAIYNYTVYNMTYDKQKAATVQSGYLPDVDLVLSSKTGICFDYAAVMTSMLRAQGIPTKLVIGYAGNAYHAWVSIYIEGTGWIDNIIYFDGSSWKLMDPTFASGSNKSAEMLSYISNPSNYQAKFSY